MKLKQILLLLFITVLLGACAGTKKNQEYSMPAFSLTFGKTGGFTNLNPVYSINNSGNLFKQTSEKTEPVLIKKLTSSQVDSIYLLLKQTDFLDPNISHPGNIANYLEFKQDNLQRKIIWTDNTQLTPACLKLHLYVTKTIKN